MARWVVVQLTALWSVALQSPLLHTLTACSTVLSFFYISESLERHSLTGASLSAIAKSMQSANLFRAATAFVTSCLASLRLLLFRCQFLLQVATRRRWTVHCIPLPGSGRACSR